MSTDARRSHILFDDLFNVSAVDRDGKKFDRGAVIILPRATDAAYQASTAVSRVTAKSENLEMDLSLDVSRLREAQIA